MLITEKKLRSIINQVLSEVGMNMPKGFSMYDKSVGGGAGGSGGGGGGNPIFEEFYNILSEAVYESGQKVSAVSVIDPNALEEEYGGVTDDIHSALNGNQSNNIYHNFGQGMQEDNIEDIFRAEGPNALEDFFSWAESDFTDFQESDIFPTDDSVSAFYQGNGGQEYQVTVMFF
jgi:hypothetical protein